MQMQREMQKEMQMQREMRFDGENCGSNRRSRSKSGKGLKVVSGGKDKRRWHFSIKSSDTFIPFFVFQIIFIR